MTTQSIDTPFVTSSALRSVNFFNGRLLTGDDLSREQATQAARLARLGRAAGEGIAYGFEVEEQPALSTKSEPAVTVAAGLAVARSGAVLQLDSDVDVALYRNASDAPAGAEPGNLFADCQPLAGGTYTAGAGVYLLTVAPGEQGEGRAQVNGLGNTDVPCNVALEAEAMSFRLIRLSTTNDELAAKDLLRNRIAYKCFGSDTVASVVQDPFGASVTAWGLVDMLRTQTMSDDEVPLAVLGWSIDDGIQFVDLWSVRRRLTRAAAEGDWAVLLADRRRAEAEAMVLQFQAQLGDILTTDSAPSSLMASDAFEHMPPVGLLPLAEGTGFDFENFLADVPHRQQPATIEGAHVRQILDEALAFPPIELARSEAVWLYLVRENLQTMPPVGSATVSLLFTSGHVPYRGDARFDLAYWNYASYAAIG